jgi:choline dehydrogenase-like flavoprotein
LIDAALSCGYRATDDFNGESQLGAGRFQLTQRNGVRCSAASAYLHPAHERINLRVFTDTLVLRLDLQGTRATGVRVRRRGREETLLSAREVLLAAGAYGSPQILMLSGIGPADELAPFGIAAVVDLPVGSNLQDHPLLPLTYLTDESSLLAAGTAENAALFGEGRGPLTSNIGEAGVFLSTRGDVDVPDCQLELAPVMWVDEGLSTPLDHAFAIGVCAPLKPTSRGKVTLRSARPDAKPRILHNYLATEADRATMIAGVRVAMEIFRQPVLAKLRRAPFSVPASDTESDIVAFFERRTGSSFHPTSTCAIGQVVDPELRVIGIEGLRVVDASVMPTLPRGNTNAPTITIAEKAADLIKGGVAVPAQPGVAAVAGRSPDWSR